MNKIFKEAKKNGSIQVSRLLNDPNQLKNISEYRQQVVKKKITIEVFINKSISFILKNYNRQN
jgi:hypothetical protein